MLIKNEIFNGFEVFFFYFQKKNLIDKAKIFFKGETETETETFLFFIFLRPISNFCTAEKSFYSKKNHFILVIIIRIR